ncbi:MAG TPA: helical backbone metal receptor [Vicinamibacterales bacterium]
MAPHKKPIVPLVALLLLLAAAVGRTTDQAAAQAPGRIISLIPAVTEMLFAIGAGPRVVAVSSFDTYPADVKQLPRVGALLDPNVERILSLKPDLVVVYATQNDLKEQLARAGIPVFDYRHAGLAGVATTIRALGERTRSDAKAGEVVNGIEQGLAGIRQRVAGRPRPRVLLVFGREAGTLRGIYASGGVGFLDDMLRIAGGDNVFADVKREAVEASSELVLSRRPDVILEIRAQAEAPPTAKVKADLDAWNALASVPAVRDGRIALLTDDRIVIPGPRVVEGTLTLARALHPDAFK